MQNNGHNNASRYNCNAYLGQTLRLFMPSNFALVEQTKGSPIIG
jgi:hypothetical protein